MDPSDSFAKRRPVPILSRQNKDAWFSLMKEWLEGEGLFYTITNTNNPSTPDSQLPTGFGSAKDDARTRYWLKICINEDDAERVRDLDTAKLVWDSLKDKYSEKLQGIGRQHLLNYVNYQMEPETTIDSAWTQLQTLGKKLAAFDKDMKSITSEKARFQRLLQALPDSYQPIRMSLDVQKDIKVEEGIALLQEEELRQEKSSTALAAKQQNFGRNQTTSRHRSPSHDGGDQCFLCKGPHRIRTCKYLSFAQLKVQEERARRRSRKPDLSPQLQKLQDQINQLKALSAKEEEPTHDNNAADSQASSSEEDVEEIAALSKSVTMDL